MDIPKGAKQVYVVFSTDVNPTTAETLLATMADCANAGVEEVTLVLATTGGQVASGLNLYNVLKGMPFRLVTHNAGNVDSIGNAVFLAGAPRYAAPNTTFMFHGVAFKGGDGLIMDEKATKDRLESLQADKNKIAEVITERTKVDAATVDRMFTQGQLVSATDAVGLGIVDEVRNVQLTPGAPVLSLVFKR